jgi:predicted transcriptional regulator
MYIEGPNVAHIVKALSNDFRLKMLEILDEDDSTIQTFMLRFKLSKTAVLTHLNVLEKAGFISSKMMRGSVGNQKLYHKTYDRLIFNFSPGIYDVEDEPCYEIRTEVGNFFDFKIYPPCGLTTKEHIIQKWDDPSVFFDPARIEAKLLWCALGFVEYRIPLNIPFDEEGFSRIEIILEVSAQGGLPSHPQLRIPDSVDKTKLNESMSTLSFSINGILVAVHTVNEYSRVSSKGKLTGEKGKFTPGWWRGSNYGELITIVIDDKGTSVNGIPSSTVTLANIFASTFDTPNPIIKELRSDVNLAFRIAVTQDAPAIGGFTLFGQGFGNYDQGIITRFYPNV